MNYRLLLTLILALILDGSAAAQKNNPDDRILLTVDGNPVSAGEFVRMFRKSIEPGKKGETDSYLEQFIIFRLKVAEALREGYDTTKAFRSELKGYRDQVAQSYLTDTETKENLLRKAYERSLNEVSAWHILIGIPPSASPEDTLKAWKKARDVRERIIQGEPFEDVARSSSDDPSVKNNGGYLGYFTVFQMITPFEDAAYNLRKGQISDPVRTPYGYHIIRVTDKRPSSGKIKTAHIMKAIPPGSSDIAIKAAEDTINMIYEKLRGGDSFSDLAERYSDHRESAQRGGELNWFGAGEIISEFAEASFALQKNGDYTKPVKTPYGWHIIMRTDRKAHGTFEETRSFLESRLSESYLTSISKKSFIEKLKKEYKFRINQIAFDWFVANTDTLIIQGKAKYDRSTMPGGTIYTFADQRLTTREFASHIERRGSMIDTRDSSMFITATLETYLADHIINYENSVLEKKYDEFRYLVKEFHDGILLFEISGNKVWNRVQNDSSGLRAFYELNRHKYLSAEQMTAKVYIVKDENSGKKLFSAYRKFARSADTDQRLIMKFTSKGDTLIEISERTWTRGESREMESFEWRPGNHETIIGAYPALVIVKEVIPPAPLPFSEVQGEMVSAYQEELEKTWVEQLKKKYIVKIDENVLGEVRKRLDNE